MKEVKKVPYYICNTCGVQHAQTVDPPNSCLICEDERQYIHPDGQTWTTLEDMREKGNLQNILKRKKSIFTASKLNQSLRLDKQPILFSIRASMCCGIA